MIVFLKCSVGRKRAVSLLQQVNGIVVADWMYRNVGEAHCVLQAQSVGIFCERASSR